MQKFNRNYKIIFEIGQRDDQLKDLIAEKEIEVAYPFTLKLQTSQGINFSNVGSCVLQLYNLPEEVQKDLYKDNYSNKRYILMQLCAGYEDTMPVIFEGFVNQCYTYRNGGSTDYITEIQADNNSLICLYGFSNSTFAEGTDPIDMIQELLKDTYGFTLGYITPELKPLKRDKTFIGQTLDLLGREYGGYDIFIDKGELNILGEKDVIPADSLLVITSESGLLGSPKKAAQFLNIEMLFEPRIKVGQAIELLSDSIPWFNQVYKVIAVEHQGIISPVQNGALITKLTLSLGEVPFEEVRKSTQKNDGQAKNINWQIPLEKYNRISTNFGYRSVHPVTGEKNKMHNGIDLAVEMNTPVLAAADGKVSFAGWNGSATEGYGRLIIINHGGGVSSYYAHLNAIDISVNSQVMKGQQIGKVGKTGYATGPHLHFEIRVNDKPLDPRQYINF